MTKKLSVQDTYFDTLTAENFTYFAARHYINPQCESIEEFYEDLSKFKYIKKLLTKYEDRGGVNTRLLLNHIITVYNVFSIDAANALLFFKVNKTHWPILKTFLIFLKYLPENAYVEIPLDQKLVQELRRI